MSEMNTLWGLYSVMTNYITNEVAPNNIARSANMSMLLYKVMKDIIEKREEFNARQITSEV